MKIGKVSETILKRSILKQISVKRPEVLVGAAVGEDCAALQLSEDEVLVMSVDPITGTTKDIGELAINITVNDIASAGAEPIGVMLSVLLPPTIEESDIREMMKQVNHACEKLNIQTIGGHTEVTNVVNQAVITVTGVGKVKKDSLIITGGASAGQDIVVTKWIGLEGTSIIAKEKEEDLLTRFAPSFVDTSKSFDKYISIVPEAAVAAMSGVTAMHDITEGGIFGALWEAAQASGVGLEVDLKSIPVRQETIEICNYYDINPYELISSGSLLIITENGHDLVRELDKKNISAVVIGKTTNNNDKLIINGDEKRYLDPPKTDELYKVI